MILFQYFIADVLFRVEVDDKFIIAHDNAFRLQNAESGFAAGGAYMNVCCKVDYGVSHGSNPGKSPISIEKQGDAFRILMCDESGGGAHVVWADECFQNATITSSFAQKLPFEGSAGEVLFRTTILLRQGIVIHSAAVDCSGSGIIFSAPSGTGKSTQANLWRKHKGAVVLNGDRPALRVVDGRVYVYGTPWSGSSPDSVNKSSPLKAIVMLEQSDANSIRQLEKPEAVRYLMPRCYLPYGVADLLERAVDNMDSIIERVPVYLLRCRPDAEAVEITGKCLNL